MIHANFNFPVIRLKKIELPLSSPFQSVIDELLPQVNTLTGRRNRSSIETLKKRLEAARLLLEALYRCYTSAHPHTAVVLPASPRAFKYDDPDRVNNVGHKIVRSLVNSMIQMGWVLETKGFLDAERKIPTVIRPAGNLLSLFVSTGHNWRPRPTPPSRSLVRMKNYDSVERKGYLIPPPENDTVRRMRSELNRINQFLGQQCIALMVRNETFEDLAMQLGQWRTKEGQQVPPSVIDCQSVFLYRVFNRSSLEYGGRLYFPWWESIPKNMRVHITIDGLPTCEIDFSALHPTLLYHQAGIALPDGDLYAIDLPINKVDSSPEEKSEQRSVIKEFVNAKLNDERNEYKLSPEQQAILGVSTKELIRRLSEKMPAVIQHFGTGIGLKLQRIDADIAVRVLLSLMEKGVVCLPIHDSFIVQKNHAEKLRQAMVNAYLEVAGRPIGFKEKTLFDNDSSGQRIIAPEFTVQFDAAGQPDLPATWKQLDDAWHSDMIRSHRAYQQTLQQAAQQKRGRRSRSRTIL